MLARRCIRVGRCLYNAAVRNRRQVVGCQSISRRPNVLLQALTPKHLGTAAGPAELSSVEYERICDATLESLYEFFEVLVENHGELGGGDVTYSDGVLTVNLGKNGTYVINRQSPNKQIWLSSPKSGPKRKDLRECYSQLEQVNSDLLRSYALRSANHNEILSTLRNINNIIQNAARLRVGRNKSEIAQQCKLAVANNNVNALIKIIKTGEV